MTEHHSSALRFVKRREIIALIVLVLLGIAAFAAMPRGGLHSLSPEVRFTDASKSGLAIVPASCPSNPHFAGDCTTNPPPPPGNCSLTATDDSIAPGGQTRLSWATGNYQWFVTSVSPTDGSLTPDVGSVNPVHGSQVISPDQTTTYRLSGDYVLGGAITVGRFSCSHTVYVTPCPDGFTAENGKCVFTTCSAGHVLQNGICVWVGGQCTPGLICQGDYSAYQAANCALSQKTYCPYGCVDGSCFIPTPSIVTWNVVPTLVHSNGTVEVTWAAQHVSSCTVQGTNGDAWTGASGDETSQPIIGQTIYTITCQGVQGSNPPSVSKTTTVNIVPLFNEQ